LFEGFINLSNFDIILIAGDLNAQYIGWESTNNNFAGTSLNEYLLSPITFIILNDGSGTRISASINYISCPDVTLVKFIYFFVECW